MATKFNAEEIAALLAKVNGETEQAEPREVTLQNITLRRRATDTKWHLRGFDPVRESNTVITDDKVIATVLDAVKKSGAKAPKVAEHKFDDAVVLTRDIPGLILAKVIAIKDTAAGNKRDTLVEFKEWAASKGIEQNADDPWLA